MISILCKKLPHQGKILLSNKRLLPVKKYTKHGNEVNNKYFFSW